MFGGMLNPATHYAGKYLHVKSTQGCSAQRSLQARSRRPSRTKGSRRDRVTPSRVSQTIRVLETRVGGKLFDRTSRRVRLTPLGERLRDDVAPAYEQLHRAYADAHEIATGVAGTLRLGMYTPVLGGPHLLDIVKIFQTRHPDCRVQLIEDGFDPRAARAAPPRRGRPAGDAPALRSPGHRDRADPVPGRPRRLG